MLLLIDMPFLLLVLTSLIFVKDLPLRIFSLNFNLMTTALDIETPVCPFLGVADFNTGAVLSFAAEMSNVNPCNSKRDNTQIIAILFLSIINSNGFNEL